METFAVGRIFRRAELLLRRVLLGDPRRAALVGARRGMFQCREQQLFGIGDDAHFRA